MSLKDLLRHWTPQSLLDWNRARKKKKVNQALDQQKSKGEAITQAKLEKQLKAMGIQKGDSILVHSALSKMGYLEEGPKTLVNALLEVIGENGNLLMPTSPNAQFQLDYIQSLDCFDVNESPSKLGAITEYFRKLPGVKRSLSATEPIAAYGPLADYFIEGHFNQLTPYNNQSPFYRLVEQKGKILYVGVTLANAGTSLHLLEDAVSDFKFPVYYPEVFNVKVKDAHGQIHQVKTKVHDPKQSKLRQCDGLIPLFKEKGVMTSVKLGHADVLLADAKFMYDVMIDEYHKNGVTMYTPKGS